MGELVKRPAGSNDRALALFAADWSSWDHQQARQIVEQGANVDHAIELLKASALPARKVEPNGMVKGRRGPKTNKLMQGLRLIGAKISPTMSAEQIDVWLAAMVTALSDLPFSFALRGVEDAIHMPMKFLNEVEENVRGGAVRAKSRHEAALARLRVFKDHMAAPERPALPPAEPMTEEDLQNMPDSLRSIGLSAGWLEEGEDGKIKWKDD